LSGCRVKNGRTQSGSFEERAAAHHI
jgi:hypothetical protein